MPKNKLQQFLDKHRSSTAVPPVKGQRLSERHQISFALLKLTGNKIGICDPSLIPSGIMVDCPSGTYNVEAECYLYGNDARIAGIRVQQDGTRPTWRVSVGEFSVDLAMACVFDADVLNTWAENDSEAYEEWIEETVVMYDWQSTGTLVCRPAKTEILYFEAGFGDGTYQVYCLQQESSPVGIEIIFLEETAEYPFNVPGQPQAP